MKNKKVLFYDKMNELINMGFDLEKNSALDLISAVYELIQLEEIEKRMDEGFKNIEMFEKMDEIIKQFEKETDDFIKKEKGRK